MIRFWSCRLFMIVFQTFESAGSLRAPFDRKSLGVQPQVGFLFLEPSRQFFSLPGLARFFAALAAGGIIIERLSGLLRVVGGLTDYFLVGRVLLFDDRKS